MDLHAEGWGPFIYFRILGNKSISQAAEKSGSRGRGGVECWNQRVLRVLKIGVKGCPAHLVAGGLPKETKTQFYLGKKGPGVNYWCLFANRDLSSASHHTVHKTEKQGYLGPVRRGGGAERERRT